MADTKISALPSGAPAQAGDEYVIARSGANYKLTLTNIAANMPATTVASGNLIVSSGNVGIGTASPDAKLTVSGGAASFADGTSSAPAIANAGDLDTGVYFPAANEVAVTTGGTVAAAFNSNGLFFRNRIINGDMRIDQRNAGASVTPTDLAYTLDRWQSRQNVASKYSVQQSSSAPSGFNNSLLVTSLSAYSVNATDIFYIRQNIEGFNVSDLGWGTASAQSVTVSFWVFSSLTGTFGGAVNNSAVDRSYPFSYTISSANTWEKKTVTIAGDTSGTWLTTSGTGLRLVFSLGVGSNLVGTSGVWASTAYYAPTGAVSVVGTNGATWYITGVQLETGSVATPFERRPYGTELMLCQRYFQPIKAITGTSGGSTTTVYANFQYSEMRGTPTYAVTGALVFTAPGVASYTQSSGNVAVVGHSNSLGAFLSFGNLSGMTAGDVIMLNAAGTFLTLSAEL